MRIGTEWTGPDGSMQKIEFEEGSHWPLGLFSLGQNPKVKFTEGVISITQAHLQEYTSKNIIERPIIAGVEPFIDYSTFSTHESPGKHQTMITTGALPERFSIDFFPNYNSDSVLACGTITPVTVRFSIK
jgi:hypothetical protein